MMNYRRIVIRILAFFAVVGVEISGAMISRAAPTSQATFIYDQDAITLVNSGETVIDISLLTFIRDDDTAPTSTRFEGRSWAIDLLDPGECVQLRSTGAGRLNRQNCTRLVRWLATTREDVYFWQKADGVKQFRVASGSEEVATCEIAAGRCTFTLSGSPRFEDLALTYTTTSFYLSNDGVTPAPLGRLRLCDVTTTGEAAPPCYPLVDSEMTLDPGACLKIGPSVTDFESNCASISTLPLKDIFWQASFAVISPVTASSMLCPAAESDRPQRCMVPR